MNTTTSQVLLPGFEEGHASIDDMHVSDTDKQLVAFVYKVVFKFVAPIVIFSGTCGNILSLFVLLSQFFRKSPSAFILSLLTLTDTAVLLCGGLPRHLTDFTVDIRAFNTATCYIHTISTYYLCQLSSWTLVLLTLERMACVKWPLIAKQKLTKHKMVAAWFGIAVVLGIINGHWFKTAGIVSTPDGTSNACYMLKEFQWFTKKIWPWMDTIILSVLPLMVIFTCNIMIIHVLLKAKHVRNKVTNGHNNLDDSTQITAMLIGLNITFFVTTVPVSIYYIGEGLFLDPARPSTHIASAVCTIIYYLSNSTNFLVYCVAGSKFRRALLTIVCFQKEKLVNGLSALKKRTTSIGKSKSSCEKSSTYTLSSCTNISMKSTDISTITSVNQSTHLGGQNNITDCNIVTVEVTRLTFDVEISEDSSTHCASRKNETVETLNEGRHMGGVMNPAFAMGEGDPGDGISTAANNYTCYISTVSEETQM